MHKGKDKSCGCQHDAPYGGRPRMPLTFGDGGFVSKTLTDDIDALVAEHYKGDEKLAARAKAMLKQLAYGGLTDKTSGSIDVGVDPDAGKSTAAFDLGLVKDDTLERKSEALEGTFKEELKDVGRFATKTVLGTAAGVVDAGAAMLGADLDTSSLVQDMTLGEINPEEIRRREIASGIGSTIGATAATVVGGVVTGGNPNIIASGAGQAFEELGQIDEDNEALQTVSNIGETGAEIYGTVAGGVQRADDAGLLTEVTDEMTKGEKRATRMQNLGTILGETVSGSGATGSQGIPNVSAAGGYVQMLHGGPHTQTEALLSFLENYNENLGPYQQQQLMQTAMEGTRQDLAEEEQRVEDVRGNVMTTAKDMAALNRRIMSATPDDPEAYAALQHFNKLRNQYNTPEETRELTRTAPSLLKQMLPNYGAYNLQLLNPSKYDAGDELYCTPMGCDTYRRSGGTDVPMVSGNVGFTSAAKSGEYYGNYFPFESIPESERVPGDLTTQSDLTVMDYRPGAGRMPVVGTRPHHTMVYAGPGTQEGSIMSYQVDSGQRGEYKLKEQVLPTMEQELDKKEYYENRGYTVRDPQDPSFNYYRYVGGVPQYQEELDAREQLYQGLLNQGFFDMREIEKLQAKPVPLPGYQSDSSDKLPEITQTSIADLVEPQKRKLFRGRKKDEGGSIDYKKGGSYQGGLRRWFKEKWVDVKTGKPCGRSGKEKSKRGYPYCRPSKRVSSKTPATSKHSAAKSRAAQKTGPKRVKPIMRKRSKK